ncbi:hypothetical protein [Roseovarius indicus]|uniref:hypothetical protein n=1 Tax=Roseovarius indicus TaxID=540747 RepID=UPI0007D96BB5|nr:hypothetical protein [Roseovarius indicus]OAO07381.1 hypothetical protein A8B76_17115 [Roseovarius indicus]
MPKPLAIVTGLFLAGLAALPLQAAELVMVQRPGCHWCQQWNEEIGISYHKTEEARRAPLRRVEISALPDDIDFASKPVFTPTFVLVEDGQELGRIEGYPGAHFFWPMLDQLLDAHPEATRPGGS